MRIPGTNGRRYGLSMLGAACLIALAALGCSKQRGEQHRLEGDAYLKLGRYAEASDAYRRAITSQPSNAVARVGLGRCLILENKPDEAAQEFKKAIELDGANEAAYIELVNVQLGQKNAEEALATASQFEAVNPERGGLLHASVWLRTGHMEEAATLLTHLRDQFSSNPEVRISLAVAFMGTQKPDLAQAELETVLGSLAPDSIEARMALANVHKMQGKLDDAVTELQGLSQQQPDNMDVKLVLARTLVEAGRADEAETLARALLTDNPGSGWANYVMGCCLLDKQQYANAVTCLELARAALPDDANVAGALAAARAGGDAKTGAPRQPMPAQANAAVESPKDWQSLWREAALGRLLQARDTFLAKEEPNLRETLALAALFTNDGPLAEQLAAPLPEDSPVRACISAVRQSNLTDALSLCEQWKESADDRRIFRENVLGYVMAKGGARARAIGVFSNALRTWPDNTVSLYNIAQVYRDSDMAEFAARALQRLVSQYPDNSDAWTLLYAIYREKGMTPEARTVAESFYSAFPQAREAILDLSQAYLDTQDMVLAQKTLERGLEILPGDASLETALGTVLLYAGEPGQARKLLESVTPTPDLAVRITAATALSCALLGDWDAVLACSKDLDARDVPPSLRLVRAAACVKSGRPEEVVHVLAPEGVARPAGLIGEVILTALGQPGKAPLSSDATALGRALGANTESLGDFALAAAFESGQLYDDAFATLRALDAKLTENPTLLSLAFSCLAHARRVPDPAKEAQSFANAHAGCAAAWMGLAEVLRATGDMEEQQKALEKAEALDPKDPKVWYQEAALMDREDDLDGQIAAYRHILEISPKDAMANNNLAYCLLMKGGDAQEALAHALEAIGKLQGSAMAHHTLGVAQLRTGDLEQSTKNLTTALELRPGDPTLLLDYGQLLVAKGQKEEGQQQVKLALQYADQLGLDFPRRAEAEGMVATQ